MRGLSFDPDRARTYRRVRRSVISFGQSYMAGTFSAEPSRMHRVIDALWVAPPANFPLVCIAGPRDSAKSSFTRAGMAWLGLHAPYFRFGCVAGATSRLGQKHLAPIRSLFKSRQIQAHYGDLIVPKHDAETYFEIYKPQDLSRPPEERRTVRYEVIAPGSDIRGMTYFSAGRTVRPQRILDDDAERKAARRSMKLLESYRTWFAQDLVGSLDWTTGESSIWKVGNLITKRSAIGEIMAGVPFADPRERAWPLGGIRTYGKSDPRLASRRDKWTRLKFSAILDDGTSYWPERWTVAMIREAMERMDQMLPGAGSREYLQEEVDPGLRPFTEGVLDVANYGPMPTNAEQARDLCPGFIALAVDDAKAVNDWNDFTAIAVAGRTRDGRAAIIDADQKRVPVQECPGYVLRWVLRWRPNVLIGEDERLMMQVAELARDAGVPIGTVKAHRVGDQKFKHPRICYMATDISAGNIVFATNHEAIKSVMYDYDDQAEHDDLVDAIQTVVEEVLRGTHSGVPEIQTTVPDDLGKWERDFEDVLDAL